RVHGHSSGMPSGATVRNDHCTGAARVPEFTVTVYVVLGARTWVGLKVTLVFVASQLSVPGIRFCASSVICRVTEAGSTALENVALALVVVATELAPDFGMTAVTMVGLRSSVEYTAST